MSTHWGDSRHDREALDRHITRPDDRDNDTWRCAKCGGPLLADEDEYCDDCRPQAA